LGIDFQQQIRELRFSDPVIERGAQLDRFWVLFLGSQRRQMQLVIDPQFTGLDGFGSLTVQCTLACTRGLVSIHRPPGPSCVECYFGNQNGVWLLSSQR
jgi:hypothetical protein